MVRKMMKKIKRGPGRPRKFAVGDKVTTIHNKNGRIVDCYRKYYKNSRTFVYLVRFSRWELQEYTSNQLAKRCET